MPDLPERLAPFNACSPTVRLSFDGRQLTLFGRTVRRYPAVFGLAGRTSDLSVKHQRDRNSGPIPAGDYWIDPEQMHTQPEWETWLGRHTTLGDRLFAGWGKHRITIHIMPATETYGRGGFFIHGGTHAGSAGCIHVVADGMETFLTDLRQELGGLGRCAVALKVKYP